MLGCVSLKKSVNARPENALTESHNYSKIRNVETHRPCRTLILSHRRCTGNRRLPAIPRVRNGGECIALAGNSFSKEAIHITLSLIGDIASIVGLILAVLDIAFSKSKKK